MSARPELAAGHDRRWWTLSVLCAGVFMVVIDRTIVNVALPSIRVELGFSEVSLIWVVNAYLLTFAGFLLLAGRAGDLSGQRRFFLIGVAVFTLASCGCGTANSQWLLIAARAIQGLGSAIVMASSLSLIANLFREACDRAKAMGIYGFVYGAGQIFGVLLGGVVVSAVNWHWIFLINIPVGVLVLAFFALSSTGYVEHLKPGGFDIAGAASITAFSLLAVYGILNGNMTGWASAQTLGIAAGALSSLLLFLFIEAHTRAPLVPLRILRLRNLAVANTVNVLSSAAVSSWFVICALYLQYVLGLDPERVGLALLPAQLTLAASSLGLSAKLVIRFGIRGPLTTGLMLIATSLLIFALAPTSGSLAIDLLPGMLLMGLGTGMAFTPLSLAALADVTPTESGLASGVLNTVGLLGGAVGLATLASVAASKTSHTLASGASLSIALDSGYRAAFFDGAMLALIAAIVSGTLLRGGKAAPA